MKTLDGHSSGAPAITERIRADLLRERPPAHEPLPSYRKLGERYQVSVPTIQSAMAQLEREGIVRRMERRGAFFQPQAVLSEAKRAACPLKCVNVSSGLGTITAHERIHMVMRDEFLESYTEVLDRYGIGLRVVPPAGSGPYEPLFSDRFPFQQQGFVIMDFSNAGFMQWLSDRNVPFVLQAYRPYPEQTLPPHHSVVKNKAGGAQKAVAWLASLGHKRIGYMGPFTENEGCPCYVYQGYRAGLLCSALTFRETDALQFPSDRSDNVEYAMPRVRAFLAKPDLPTAFFCCTDSLAIAALRCASELGLRVPQDLSVVGFNGLPEGAKTTPPLTTVREPRREHARAVVELLIETASGAFDTFQSRVIECEWIERASAAPPSR
ncbi:MAG TPA: substrate-binding domain-containing protein [Candidatus Brocadiia bacterium]|nr:substrate-binding domain-containing protein [Candidatus Brocadiia bacterium]